MWIAGGLQITTAQSTRPSDLGAGKFLVASKDLNDPNFAKTVVLLVEYNDDGVVGLIVNRRSKVPISRVLEDVKAAKERADLVYAGGPVDRTEILALMRSTHAPEDSERVFGDVYLVTSRNSLQQTFASQIEPNRMHVFVGYAGWTVPQLENELDLGAWYIFPGTAAAVYDADPDTLWPRLIRETELRIASADHVAAGR